MGRKQRFLKFLNCKHSFFSRFQTKKEFINEILVRKLWANSNYDFSFVPPVGLSVGLCLILNLSLITVLCQELDGFVCLLTGFLLRGIWFWFMLLMYLRNIKEYGRNFNPFWFLMGLFLWLGIWTRLLYQKSNVNVVIFFLNASV